MELPGFERTLHQPGVSSAVHAFNDEGGRGWEAVGLTPVADGKLVALQKRPRITLQKRPRITSTRERTNPSELVFTSPRPHAVGVYGNGKYCNVVVGCAPGNLGDDLVQEALEGKPVVPAERLGQLPYPFVGGPVSPLDETVGVENQDRPRDQLVEVVDAGHTEACTEREVVAGLQDLYRAPL